MKHTSLHGNKQCIEINTSIKEEQDKTTSALDTGNSHCFGTSKK